MAGTHASATRLPSKTRQASKPAPHCEFSQGCEFLQESLNFPRWSSGFRVLAQRASFALQPSSLCLSEQLLPAALLLERLLLERLLLKHWRMPWLQRVLALAFAVTHVHSAFAR
jgi:hypothetical protein